MFFCEECRVKRGWPQSFGGSYGRCEFCGTSRNCYDVPSSLLPIPELGTSASYDNDEISYDNDEMHQEHCCQKHGCKYYGTVGGATACPVVRNGGQKLMCVYCHEEIYEEGGWEDAHLLNEMFKKGEKHAWAEIVKLSKAASFDWKKGET